MSVLESCCRKISYNPNDETFQLYGQEEGIDVIEYCDGASFVDQQSQTLYFGGINGFVTIHKEKLKTEESIFPILISNLNVLGENVMLADFLSQEKDKNKLSLNYQQHSFNDYARKYGLLKEKDKNLEGNDVREGLSAIISIKVPEHYLQFEGQTKSKLGTPEARNIEIILSDKLQKRT